VHFLWQAARRDEVTIGSVRVEVNGVRTTEVALVAPSRAGKQVVAKRSGHHIPLDEPDLVVAAIRDAIRVARDKAPSHSILETAALLVGNGPAESADLTKHIDLVRQEHI
jgi:hypothetical protein